VLELDLLRHRHTVLGDARGAEALVEHDVAALRAEGHSHRIGEDVDAAQHLVARVGGEFDVLGSHVHFTPYGYVSVGSGESCRQAAFFLATSASSTPMMSLSFMIRYSTPSILTSVPDHLPNSTRSPVLTSIGISLPDSSRPPLPTAITSPWEGFSFAVSGMMIPPAVFSSASMRLTTTRS